MHRGVRRAAAAVVLTTGLGGCAYPGEPSPPAGVDELTIPTPSPDPDDFVAEVDNPWLALTPGRSLTLSGPTGSYTVRVGEETETVDGVTVTSVQPSSSTTSYDGDREVGVTGLFTPLLLAQDADGNVWQFVEGAEPGLFMAATPRYGDGYRTAYEPDVIEERAEVTRLEGDTVEITTTDPARPGADTVATYEKGVGLVRLETGEGVFER